MSPCYHNTHIKLHHQIDHQPHYRMGIRITVNMNDHWEDIFDQHQSADFNSGLSTPQTRNNIRSNVSRIFRQSPRHSQISNQRFTRVCSRARSCPGHCQRKHAKSKKAKKEVSWARQYVRNEDLLNTVFFATTATACCTMLAMAFEYRMRVRAVKYITPFNVLGRLFRLFE